MPATAHRARGGSRSAQASARGGAASAIEKLISVEDLSGGLDLRKAPALLKPNRARLLRNWSLREPGALNVVPGWRTLSTASLGNSRVQGAQRIYLAAGTPFFLAAWNGGVYKPSDAGVWGAAVSAGWSTATDIFLPYNRDLVAILDGVTTAQKSLDGTSWTKFGIDPPAGAPTTALVAGGTLVSAHVYEFSYSGQDNTLLAESNESPTVQATPAGATLTVRLTLARLTDPQVATLVVYGRDVTAGESTRRRIGTVANPGAGSATFDVTANNWASGVPTPTDHNVPPLLAWAIVWKNRWWGKSATVGNRLFFTQVFAPQSWPATFYLDLPFERGDTIAAAIPLGDVLLVFGQSKVFLILGQTSLDFEVRPSGTSQAGALGARAVDVLEDGVVHASAEGIYLFDGASDRLLSDDVDGFAPSALGWRVYVTTASAADLARTPLVYHQAAKEIAIGVTNLYPFGTAGEWILDLHRTRLQDVPAWTTTDRVIGGYVKWDGNEAVVGNRGRLFSWSPAIGKLYEERTGTSADGQDLVSDYEGPEFVTSPYWASFPESFIEYQPTTLGGVFGVTLVVDGVSQGTQVVPIATGAAILGQAVAGAAVLGGANRRQTPLSWPLEAEGQAVQLRATYTGQAPFKWFGYRIGALAEPIPSGI